MTWIIEHIGLLVVATLVLAFLLSRRTQVTRRGMDDGRPILRGQTNDVQAERTRRIREEIRRKIAERTTTDAPSGAAPRPAELAPPLIRTVKISPIDPFGGPISRVLKKVMSALQKPRDS
jgi:hypothetical protein